MKKFAFIIITAIIVGLVLYFGYLNAPINIEYRCVFNQRMYGASLGKLALVMSFFSALGGFLYALFLQEHVNKLCNAYKKKNDSIAVKSEEDSAKIQTLEAKIQTLEAALQSALNKE